MGQTEKTSERALVFRNAPDSCRKRAVPALTFGAIRGRIGCVGSSLNWPGSRLSSLGYDERVALICGERCQLAPEQHQRGHYRWSQKKAEKLEAFDASEDAKQNP